MCWEDGGISPEDVTLRHVVEEVEIRVISDAQAVYSPNGGMAHIYLRPDTGIPWDSPTALNCNSNFVVASSFALANSLADNPFEKRFAAVLYRDVNAWNSGYSRITLDEQDRPQSSPLTTLPADWNIESRIAELSSSRSGDVILIFGESNGTRYIGWNWEKEEYKAWHGEPDEGSSKVPLVFSFTGGDIGQLDALIDSEGDTTNADLTSYIMDILSEVRADEI